MAEAKITIEFRLLKFGSSVWFSVTAVGSFSWNENQCKLSDFPPFDIVFVIKGGMWKPAILGDLNH